MAAHRVRSVLFITHHFPPEVGGIQTRVMNYMRTLRTMGIGVSVLYFSVSEKQPWTTDEYGCRVIARRGSVRRLPWNFLTIVRTTISEKADVIHVISGAATLVSIAALVVGRVLRIPSAVSFFGKEEFDLRKLTQRLGFPIALALSTVILVNTTFTSTLVPRRYQRKTKVILGGAESAQTTPSAPSSRVVLFVGRLVKSKGVDDLLSAFKSVRAQVPDSELVIVGDGPEKEALLGMVEALGIGESVRFTGILRGRNLHTEYQNSAVVVLPSKTVPGEVVTETFGFSLVEGAMHGRPLIGTRHGGIPEIVTDNCNGLLIPEANPARLAKAIETLLLDEKLATFYGQNSLRIAKERFTWEVATKRLLGAYVLEPPGFLAKPNGEASLSNGQ